MGWATDPEVLGEFAGRLCYQAWGRKNPATAKTSDYLIRNILDKGHESVLEHPTATLYVRGMSRACAYELLRHRHLSRSELSQRYVPMKDARFVMPPALMEASRVASGEEYPGDQEAEDHYQTSDMWIDVREAYDEFGELFDLAEDAGMRELSTKERREAARSCLPNATETEFVTTGNVRAWRHVVKLRGALDADAEIRQFAVSVYRLLSEEAPSLWADMELGTTPDGREFIRERSTTPAQIDGDVPFREQTPGDLGIAADTDD